MILEGHPCAASRSHFVPSHGLYRPQNSIKSGIESTNRKWVTTPARSRSEVCLFVELLVIWVMLSNKLCVHVAVWSRVPINRNSRAQSRRIAEVRDWNAVLAVCCKPSWVEPQSAELTTSTRSKSIYGRQTTLLVMTKKSWRAIYC